MHIVQWARISPRSRTRAKSLLSLGATRVSMCSKKKSRLMSSTPGLLPRERLFMASVTLSLEIRLAVFSP